MKAEKKKYKHIRKFKKDFHTILKGQCVGIEQFEINPKNKKYFEVEFDILEEDLSFITKVSFNFTTSSWAEFWNCTEEI